MDREDVKRFLANNPGWRVYRRHIVKTYILGGFMDTVKFIVEVSKLSEDLNHHPDICLHSYRKVTIRCKTKEIDGISLKDIDLARKIDKIYKRFNRPQPP